VPTRHQELGKDISPDLC